MPSPTYALFRNTILTALCRGNRKHGEKQVADFIVQRDPEFPQVVQLIGIESPGLTSALAIAERASGLVAEILA